MSSKGGPVGKPLHVLVVEDSDDDAALMVRWLRQEGYAPSYRRVDTAEAMRAALAERSWDLVITDYTLPQFSGPRALEVLKASGRDLPIIVVSGTIADETAVAAMRAGAHDYVAKS